MPSPGFCLPDLRGPIIVRHLVTSELRRWIGVEVTEEEQKIFIGASEGMARIEWYFLPARNLIVRYVPASFDKWQALDVTNSGEPFNV